MSTIEAVSGATETSPSTRVENPGATLDRDAFLKLLVAQLKYQDPTKPADTSQMLAQSAQLTMVDRLNELSEAFATSLATQRLSLAGTIVGRDITFVDADGALATQTVLSARVSPDGLVLLTADYEVPYEAVAAVSAAPTVSGTSDPAASDPATSDPATSDPATSDPATSDPATSDPATSDPATSDPATGDSSTTDPATTSET